MKNNSIHTVRDDMHASASNYSPHPESEKFKGKKDSKLDHINTPYNPVQDRNSRDEQDKERSKVNPTPLEDKDSVDPDKHRGKGSERQ